MPIPAIPAHGASWDSWAAGVDAAARGAAQVADIGTAGTSTGDALRAALVPQVADPTALAAFVAALPSGTSYLVVQRTPFDIIQGVKP